MGSDVKLRPSQLNISAVVVNYNAGDFLNECVDLLAPQVKEVFIVDNASSDFSIENCEQLNKQNSRVKFIQNGKNLGFAAACNIGFFHASGDYILFLNPDCCLELGAVSSLMNVLKGDAEVGMVGGLLLNPDGTEQVGGRRAVPTPWRTLVRAFKLSGLSRRWPKLFFDYNLHLQPLPKRALEVEAISGACMLTTREAIENVGLWDEAYFLHCEDLDWCMRFRQKGWKILFVPDAKIMHEQGVCGRSRPIFVEWHKHKGMIRFYRKFFQHQYPGVLMWLVMLGVWVRFSLIAIVYTVKRVLNTFGGGA